MTAAPAATSRALDRLLRPRAVAVLGASARPGALSGRFIGGLQRHGFRGRIAPVNPRYDQVAGLRCFPTIADAAAEGPIDCAIVSLPRAAVLDSLEQCHAAGVAGAAVFASGFGEVGEEGRAEQQQLSALAARAGLRILGPNSPGFLNVTDATCVIASGVSFRERLVPGAIAVVAQSGGAAGLIVERAQDAGAGISVAVCTGNEADLAVADLLPWLAADPATRVVTVFLEGVRKPADLRAGLAALRAAGKPVVVLKAGTTEAAARATAAHTGALATADHVVDAVLARHRAVRVHGFDDLIDTAVALERLGPARGRRTGIVTTSGGAGVVATEAAERAELELPPLAPATRDRLRAVVPDFASLGNPADMSGMFSEDPEIFRGALAAVGQARELDVAVLVLTVHPPQPAHKLADRLLAQRDAPGGAPVVLWTAGAMSAPARARLREGGLCVLEDADRCMRALAARAVVGAPDDAPPLPPADLAALGAAGALPEGRPPREDEALALLGAAGVPVVETARCADARAAAAAAERVGGAVVVKAAAGDLPHKSDAGAVVVGVEGGHAAADAHDRVLAAARAAGATPEGSLVQPLAPAGVELVVGVRRDPDFGLVLVVGPGGLTAELLGDVSRRLLPLRAGEAEAMLRELRAFPLLDGFRGQPPGDVAAAATAVERLAAVAIALGPRLEALEVNPLIVHPRGAGATAVDALLLLGAAP